MGRRLQTADPSFQTHGAYYQNVATTQDLDIIENVPEYNSGIVKKALGPAFSVTCVKLDPRILGLGVARARVYYIAIRTSKLQWKPGFSIDQFMDALTSKVTLGSMDYWWKKLPPQLLSDSDETRPTLQYTYSDLKRVFKVL